MKPMETSTFVCIPSPAAGTESNARLARPKWPPENVALVNTEELMRTICIWCEQELPAAIEKCPGLAGMCKGRPFWECRPLAICEANNGSLVGHKEPFDQNKCSVAIAQKGMYVASMNINWLRAFPQGTTARQIMGDMPTLTEVHAGADS